ncbi:MAG: type II toxin-antitoxin system RelE/ParE family toxin [Defluviitaleaceae bacterium]|nr:type II toxin-antitoxin system RelE/ParE family toxin [Defluviitaleaceae bacterium]
MAREFVMTPTFDKIWGTLKLNDDDLRELQTQILKNPYAGDIITETSGARKYRFALPDTGKSAGLRVIYFDVAHVQMTFLLLCYPKSKQDNLTAEQKKQIKRVVEAIKGAL